MTKAKAAPATGKVIASEGGVNLTLNNADAGNDRPVQKAGEKGPASSIETGKGSATGASAGGEHDFEGRRGEGATTSKGQLYSVQKHDDENGVQVEYVTAESGDDAANQVLAAARYKGTSIRGVDVASAPDANSMGGERDAAIMIANAENPGDAVDPLGTEANREATEGLGKADIKELGE